MSHLLSEVTWTYYVPGGVPMRKKKTQTDDARRQRKANKLESKPSEPADRGTDNWTGNVSIGIPVD